MEHFKIVCEPFYYSKEDLITGEIKSFPQLSDMPNEEKSLINLVAAFIK